MAIGLVGRKAGMTRVFTDAGETVPVTVIEVLPNRVTQVKSQDKDGYRAVQVTYGTRRPQLYSKAVAGHYAKANVAPGKALVEFRLARRRQGRISRPAPRSRSTCSRPARRSMSPAPPSARASRAS